MPLVKDKEDSESVGSIARKTRMSHLAKIYKNFAMHLSEAISRFLSVTSREAFSFPAHSGRNSNAPRKGAKMTHSIHWKTSIEEYGTDELIKLNFASLRDFQLATERLLEDESLMASPYGIHPGMALVVPDDLFIIRSLDDKGIVFSSSKNIPPSELASALISPRDTVKKEFSPSTNKCEPPADFASYDTWQENSEETISYLKTMHAAIKK